MATLSNRKIGTLALDITTNEDHESKLKVTDNPIESGAVISDHAVLEPKNGCDWSIEGGLLNIIPATHTLPSEAVFLSQDTGMVGSPEDTGDGLEIKCLLNPALRCGGLVEIKSILSFFDGQYKITNLKMSGDALSGDWLCTISTAKGTYKKVTLDELEEQKKGEADDGQL